MNAKLAAAVIAIAVLPLVVIAWLGVRSMGHERQLVQHQFDELITTRLSDVDGVIRKVMERRETELRRALELKERNTETLRQAVRETAFVNQTFALDGDGELIHPPKLERNKGEERFFERTREIWESKEPFYHPGDGDAGPSHGWHTWYWGGGINLLFWQRSDDGTIVGGELTRMALVAEIIGELPATVPDDPGMDDLRIVLESSSGQPIYSFGNFETGEGDLPRITRSLSPPLGAWRLKYFDAPGSFDASGKGTSMIVWFGLGAIVIAVLILALFVLREHGAERREASRRVTFVNQVSHELKTPLTSIRMYAELLEDELEDEESKAPEYLGVIVSESRRLSRLIGNVLTFARKQRLRPKAAVVDDEIERVLDYHRPLFLDLGTELKFDGAAKQTCQVDVDVLGQILGNLLTNAEKYASKSGGLVEVSSKFDGDNIEITVSDNGPGIPRGMREKVFKPFYRISSKVTEGVSGTGIGLSISRDLARLHGGDISLVQSTSGASFKLVVKASGSEGGNK